MNIFINISHSRENEVDANKRKEFYSVPVPGIGYCKAGPFMCGTIRLWTFQVPAGTEARNRNHDLDMLAQETDILLKTYT